MKRIVIIGATGAGKSTLAKRLSEKLGIPVVEIDDIYWLPGWERRGPEEFAVLVEQATAAEKWIMPGNYGQTRDLVWARADIIIWLDYRFGRVLFQLIKRTYKHIKGKLPISNGNQESWSRFFSSEGILAWLIKTYSLKRRAYGKIFADPNALPNTALIHLRSPQACKEFLQRLS